EARPVPAAVKPAETATTAPVAAEAAPTSAPVAIASSEVKPAEMFVETDTPSLAANSVNAESNQSDLDLSYPTPDRGTRALSRLLVMPRATLSYIYGALIVLLGLALGLKLFMRMRRKHAGLILNGLSLIGLILFLLYANSHLFSVAPGIF